MYTAHRAAATERDRDNARGIDAESLIHRRDRGSAIPGLDRFLNCRSGARTAFILAEIFGPPLALREPAAILPGGPPPPRD